MQAGVTGRDGGQIGLGDKGTVAVQVPSRLVVEWPLQASLEAGLPLLLLPNAQLAAGEKVEDGDGQLSCSDMMCIYSLNRSSN